MNSYSLNLIPLDYKKNNFYILRMKNINEIIKRYEKNPIITPGDMHYPCNSVFNPGAALFNDEVILMLRVENYSCQSHFTIARSKDGYNFEVEKEPCMERETKKEPFKTYEARGIEDARITEIEGRYYITYSAYSKHDARVGLAVTDDFKNFERIAIIAPPANKDCVLFPEKINGKYARLERPLTPASGDMWVAYSPDMVHWGGHEFLMGKRPDFWEGHKVGASTVPIKTDEGWLLVYHGVRITASSTGIIYRAGVMLLDLDDPSKIIGIPDYYIMTPSEDYELTGDVNNVVFPSGAVYKPESDDYIIYYGAADTRVCAATAKLKDLVQICLDSKI